MKKTIISMMLAVVLFGGTAFSQNQVEGATGTAKQEQVSVKKNKAKHSKGDKKKGSKPGKKVNRQAFNPFDGIQLTDDQQQRLQTLRKGLGPVQLTPEQQAKIKENKNLSKEEKQQLKKERNAGKMETKKNYLNGVKEILTPDQYVVFLENVYLYTPQDQGMNPQGYGKKAMKSEKKAKNATKKQPKQSIQPQTETNNN